MALNMSNLRVNKTWLMLGIAIVLAILATFLTAQYLQSREATLKEEFDAESKKGPPRVAVVVPVQDLPVGVPLTDGLVALRPVPADLLYPGVITEADFAAFKDQALIRPVLKGRPLLKTDLRPMFADFAGSLIPGTRAMTIDVDELNSVSHMVQPGNRIDLMLVMRRDDGGQTVVPFMDRMKVLATGQKIMPEGDTTPGGSRKSFTYSTFTLEVTPPQAARLTLAQDLGKLRFTLRNEKDEEEPEYAVNAQNILEEVSVRARSAKRYEPTATQAAAIASNSRSSSGGPMIEFIIGGQRAGPNAKAVEVPGLQGGMPAITPPSVTPPAVTPPVSPSYPAQSGSTSPNFDANGMTPEMKAELKKLTDK